MTPQLPETPWQAVIVMGVSGSGKTTLGQALARELQWPFFDADDVHTPEARAKMARGEGLSDADRAPWLRRLHDLLAAHRERGEGMVLACSALKRSYRQDLYLPGALFVYLRVPRALLEERLRRRHHHYAGVTLLPSQLATIEEPQREAHTLVLDVDEHSSPARLAAQVQAALRGRGAASGP